jgi:predicted nucleic acid-binding Zn ribbon protein
MDTTAILKYKDKLIFICLYDIKLMGIMQIIFCYSGESSMNKNQYRQQGMTILMLMGILAVVGIVATIAIRAYTHL